MKLTNKLNTSLDSSLAPDHSLARDLTCARERVWHLEGVVIKQGMRNEETSVQAGAVLMPLAMFLLSLKSISVILVSIMNFILKLAYLYKVTEKKRLIYMHLLLLFIILCGLPGPQERRKLILPGSVVQCI